MPAKIMPKRRKYAGRSRLLGFLRLDMGVSNLTLELSGCRR